jgi:hypothetical protein
VPIGEYIGWYHCIMNNLKFVYLSIGCGVIGDEIGGKIGYATVNPRLNKSILA